MELFALIGIIAVAIPLLIGLGLLILMWRSWWLYPAWGWFVVPLGFPAIRFWHFVALTLLVGSITATSDNGKKDDREVDWSKVVVSFLWPIVVWVLLRWMR
jgi:hypothetical protein